jgi:outer membrane protein assembly factor BamB
VTSSWSQYQLNSANTGLGGTGLGFTDSPQRYWFAETRANAPIVQDGRLYLAEFSTRPVVTARTGSNGRQDWTRPLPSGPPGTSVAVANGSVIVVTREHITAVDDRSGRRQWTASLPAGPSTAPAVLGGTVFLAVGTGDQTVVRAVDANSGDTEWERTFDGRIGGSPAATERGVHVPIGRRLLTLNRFRGDEQWATTFDAPVGTPAVNQDTDRVYVVDGTWTVHACQEWDGAVRWSTEVVDGETAVPPDAPAAAGDIVAVGAPNGLHGLTASTGRSRWHVERPGPMTPPTVADNVVYAGSLADGVVVTTDLRRGDVQWTYETGPGPLPGGGDDGPGTGTNEAGDEASTDDGEGSGADTATGRAILAPVVPVAVGAYVVAADGVHALGPA